MPTWVTTGILAIAVAGTTHVLATSSWAMALAVGVVTSGVLHGLLGLCLALARVPGAMGLRAALDPVGVIRAARDRASVDADRAATERVRGNLRLMGLAELWSAVQDDDPRATLLDQVTGFCARETGHRQVGLFRFDARRGEIHGHWVDGTGDVPRTHPLRWSVGGLDGGLIRALRAERAFDTSEGAAVPLLTVNGERPAALNPDGAYRVIPMRAPAGDARCLDPASRALTECELFQPHATPEGVGSAAGAALHGPRSLCTSCRRFPVHGVLVVSGADGPPRPGAIGLLDSLGATAASVLDHAALFRDVKNAERFREQVLDGMMNGLLGTDSKGRIVFANRRARELCGEVALEGRDLDGIVALPEGSTAITRTLIEGEAHLQAEGLVRTGAEDSGPPVPVRIRVTPFRPEAGGRQGAVCVLEDLRDVRAMEEEIRHLDTLAAIGRFASSLAHEIRNPLGGIQAGIEFLGRSLENDDETRENLDVIHGEIRRLDGILRNLLTVARPRELVLGECDVADLARRAVHTFSSLAETVGVGIVLHADEGLPLVHADRDMLVQVITNLVKNALEASASGSTVEVVLHTHGEAGVEIEVLDRGPGIDEADRPHLFEPFFSRKSNGTGLGLYVCHGLVQRHGGSLRADNRSGGGARFVVELPRVPALMGGRHEPSHSGRR